MVNKDLGMVTAYAYAVSKGYTGTEEEFAELMADYADVGERAEAAAEAAAASATAASGSASDSAASATAAEGFAGNASTAAGNASQAAQNASQSATAASGSATSAAQSATQAAGSATTASTKATEAAQSATAAAGSATTAESAKTAAQAAQTAAEAAQTAAETAQGAAEDAAESVEGKTEQIDQNTEDISLLKSHLNATEIVDTASGAIASFTDGSDGVPVESLTVTMEPIQDLHGQDAPYPAGGGKNLLPDALPSNTIAATISDSGITGATNARVFAISCEANTDYTLSHAATGVATWSVAFSSKLPEIGDSIDYKGNMTNRISFTVNSGSYTYMLIGIPSEASLAAIISNKAMIEKGTTATTYAPYSNICPISGRESVTVTRSGVNVWDEEWESGSISVTNGNITDATKIRSTNYISVIPGQTYYIRSATAPITLVAYDAEKHGVRSVWSGYDTAPRQNQTVTIPSGVYYIRFYTAQTTYNHDISINYPATDTAHHPGTVASVEVQLGQTVYGGTVDVVSGEMVVDRAMVDLGTLNWTRYVQNNEQIFLSNIADAVNAPNSNVSADAYCSMLKVTNSSRVLTTEDAIIAIQFYVSGVANINAKLNSVSTKEEFKAAMNGVQLCYKLVTPLTITLTPEQLTTVLGVNNVWSDAGDVDVDYVADTKLYIQKAIAAALANV